MAWLSVKSPGLLNPESVTDDVAVATVFGANVGSAVGAGECGVGWAVLGRDVGNSDGTDDAGGTDGLDDGGDELGAGNGSEVGIGSGTVLGGGVGAGSGSAVGRGDGCELGPGLGAGELGAGVVGTSVGRAVGMG